MILTSVLLPAPFSPSSAWISPAWMARSTRSLARQPGNCLMMPVSWSSGAPARADEGAGAPGPGATVTMADPLRPSPREPSPAWPPRAFDRYRYVDSVRNLVRLFQPFLEDLPCLGRAQLDERHCPAVDRLVELAIDVVVVETDGGGVAARVGVVDAIQPRPVDGAQTHRAGLAAGVHLAALQAEGTQLAAGRADGHHLGMGGGIIAGGDLVVALGNDLAVARNDGAERPAQAGAHLLG